MPKIVITGGTKGMGKDMVLLFAKNGYDIATCSRNIKDLENLKTELNEKFPKCKTLIHACDASIKEEIIEFGNKVLSEMGIPDILINNTGIFLLGQIHNEEDGLFEKQIQTNLASAYHLSRVFLPGLMKEKRGYIFNMCSIASIKAYASGGSYTISKFGMLALSKVLREELMEYDVRVTSVLPGATRTSSWDGTDLPNERFIDPKDIAELVYYMSQSPKSMVVEEILIRPLKGDI